MKPGMLPKDIEAILAHERANPPDAAERERRARDAVYNNLAVENPRITRQRVNDAFEARRKAGP
jgi:plasmid stabilization system protein ParE